MIVWILMILDLISFTTVSLAQFNIIYSTYLLVACGSYLILKFAAFREIMSGIDAIFGAYLLIVAIFHISSFLYYFMLAWFGYKFISTLAG